MVSCNPPVARARGTHPYRIAIIWVKPQGHNVTVITGYPRPQACAWTVGHQNGWLLESGLDDLFPIDGSLFKLRIAGAEKNGLPAALRGLSKTLHSQVYAFLLVHARDQD